MAHWTLTLSREGGKSRSISVGRLWLVVPLMAALFALALQAGPWNRWPAEADPSGFSEVVPLNARDPANLVMSPYWGKCSCECPSIVKPH